MYHYYFFVLQLSSFKKGIAYYKSCVNIKEINKRGTKPLDDLIKEYGSWTLTSDDWDEESWDMIKYLSLMRRKLALGPLFTVFVSADQRNSSVNIIQVSQANKKSNKTTYGIVFVLSQPWFSTTMGGYV